MREEFVSFVSNDLVVLPPQPYSHFVVVVSWGIERVVVGGFRGVVHPMTEANGHIRVLNDRHDCVEFDACNLYHKNSKSPYMSTRILYYERELHHCGVSITFSSEMVKTNGGVVAVGTDHGVSFVGTEFFNSI